MLKSYAKGQKGRTLPRASVMVFCVVAGALATSMNAAGSTLTWEYDADDNVFPNAEGQPFQGGVQTESTFKTLIDLGDGDIVLQFDTQTTNANVGSVYEQYPGTNPANGRWMVDPVTGYSLEWRVRLDGTLATDFGACDLAFADGFTSTRLRLLRDAGDPIWTARIQDSANLSVYEVALSAETLPGFDPNEFHTFRIDVKNSMIDLYVDSVQVLNDVVDMTPNGQNRIQFGDVTGAGDGQWQMQFLRTYQDGPLDPPPPPALVGDFDGDLDVDAEDLTAWQASFGVDDGADADSDGDSDGVDFLLWQRNLGSVSQSAASLITTSASAVPEPMNLILVMIGCVGGLLRRRR